MLESLCLSLNFCSAHSLRFAVLQVGSREHRLFPFPLPAMNSATSGGQGPIVKVYCEGRGSKAPLETSPLWVGRWYRDITLPHYLLSNLVQLVIDSKSLGPK